MTVSCTSEVNNTTEKPTDSLTIPAPPKQVFTANKNIFLTMGTTVTKFLQIRGETGFKRVICQFNNTGLNTAQDGFVYDVSSYALKNSNYFDSTFMQALPTREQFNNLPTPYRFGNIELRSNAVRDFIRKLRDNGTPINTFDSVLFIPFIDYRLGSSYLNLEVIPIKARENKNNFVRITAKFNPCPPALIQ